MGMAHDLQEAFVPVLVFSIPIIAIIGGIASRITRTLARTRIQELMIQERIRAIEKGITPPEGPPMTVDPLFGDMDRSYSQHRAFGLRLGGALLLTISGAIMFALWKTGESEGYVWMTLPMAVGLVLLVASFFVPGRGAVPPGGPMTPRGPDLGGSGMRG